MAKKLTILVSCMDGVGHLNACIGLAEVLHSRGHTIVFAVDKAYEGKLSPYGFVEELLVRPAPPKADDAPKVETPPKKPSEDSAHFLVRCGILSAIPVEDKMKIMLGQGFFSGIVTKMAANEPLLKKIVDKHRPDVYIIDNFCGPASLVYSGKPWVFLFSGNPLFVLGDDERIPPGNSGYPSYEDRSKWPEFRKMFHKMFEFPAKEYNEWLTANGYPPTTNNRPIPFSPFLNLYGYPEELDYTDLRPVPDKWMAVDAFMRAEDFEGATRVAEFKIPDQLSQREGKLIYLSLGSMGCFDVELMKRLVRILSASKHRFIVAKGQLGDKYELADNMWGEKSLPQTKVLPIVDLVITHGGNNSVTETFSFGKPMIVLPLFGDQFDNAQRIHEKGYGVRLDPYLCADEELLTAIDMLLNDTKLKERLSLASKRMLSSNSLMKASKAIEELVVN